MEIDTRYASRLFFPSPSFFQIYLEAIANSFDADATEISIVVEADGGISGANMMITITDNGIGFTDERFARFRRIQEPHDAFHKGLGRLVYLHYFRRVDVLSRYDGGERSFVFSESFDGHSDIASVPSGQLRSTCLKFTGFMKDRLRSYDDLRASSIKEQIVDHFLPLLHDYRNSGRPFEISIDVRTDKEVPQQDFFATTTQVTASDIPMFDEREVSDDGALGLFDSIRMAFSIRETGSSARVLTAVSVDQRTIPIPQLLPPKAVPPGFSATFVFSSDLFTGSSDSSRQKLLLPEGVSQEQVFNILKKAIASVLTVSLPQIREKNAQIKSDFEQRYPHLIGLFDSDSVGLVDRDEAVRSAQWRFFERQKSVLEGEAMDEGTYRGSLELSARTLLEYVLYREFIIERLANISEDDREEEIHSLIVPRYHEFEGSSVGNDIYSNNAWILDDKFMSFRTILSESRMDTIIKAITLEETKPDEGRPDIALIFSADPAEESAVDVVVIEVKRRRVDDREGPYASTQLVRRARKLVEHCPNIQRMWYFGIIDIDSDLEQLLTDQKWTPLYSKGRVLYQDYRLPREDGSTVLAPTYLVSFDAVINDAKARNHTFLEILKTDVRRAVLQRDGNDSE